MIRSTFGIQLLPGDRRIEIDIRDVPRRALSLLYKIEPRIITKEFYELDPMQRRILFTPRRMLEVSGSPHEPQQIHGREILLPQISPTDPVFKMDTYGHPRHEETWFKWLTACADEIDQANARRAAAQMNVLQAMDVDIENWLTGLGAMDADALIEVVKPGVGGTWTIDWDLVPFSEGKETNRALRGRLREMAVAAGVDTVREYLLLRPETEGIARAIDEKLGMSDEWSSAPPSVNAVA